MRTRDFSKVYVNVNIIQTTLLRRVCRYLYTQKIQRYKFGIIIY